MENWRKDDHNVDIDQYGHQYVHFVCKVLVIHALLIAKLNTGYFFLWIAGLNDI